MSNTSNSQRAHRELLLSDDLVKASSAAKDNRRSSIWSRLLATSTVLVGMFTVLLHFMGAVVHQTYLAEWGVSSTQFPKSADWLLNNGYYSVWNGVAMLFSTMIQHPFWTTGVVALFLFYGWLILSSWDPISYISNKMPWMRLLPDLLRRLLLWSFVVIMASVFVVWGTAVLILLWGIPAQVGKLVGETIAESHINDFSKGCSVSKRPCIHILKEGERVGTGYLLDVSAAHLAYFDAEQHRARVVPIEGLEIQAASPPTGYVQTPK